METTCHGSIRTGLRLKDKITEEPWFYERTGHAHSAECPHCREHKYVILQKMGAYYTMHSHVQKSSLLRYLHTWDARANDPICLLDFKKVKAVPGWKPRLTLKKPVTLSKPDLVSLGNQWGMDFESYVDTLNAQMAAQQVPAALGGGPIPSGDGPLANFDWNSVTQETTTSWTEPPDLDDDSDYDD